MNDKSDYNNSDNTPELSEINDLSLLENLEDEFLFYNIAENFRQKNELSEAINNYIKSIDKYPGIVNAYYSLGEIFVSQNNYLKASKRSHEGWWKGIKSWNSG